MRILVAGAGSVGSVLGILLHNSREDVIFLARGERLEQLRSGLAVEFNGERFEEHVPVLESCDEGEEVDVVLLCVKSYSTPDILDSITSCIGPETFVVSLQNGIGNEEVIAERFGEDRTVGGIIVVGSDMDRTGFVRCYKLEEVVMGIWGSSPDMGCLREVFEKAGIDCQIAEDIRSEKWKKMVWNSAFNPVTAITGKLVEDVLAEEQSKGLVTGLMKETASVARTLGYSIPDDIVDRNLVYPPEYFGFRTSMQQDMMSGKKLEFEAITGVVVREGKRLGIEVPLNETLYAVLTTMSAGKNVF